MKHLLLMTAVLCLSFSGFSQDEDPRSWLVGGSFYYTHDSNPITYLLVNNGSVDRGHTSDRFNIRLSFGKIINTNWIIGLAPGFSTSSSKSDEIVINNIALDEQKQNSNSISISAFARYTINPENRFNIYLRPNIQFSSSKTKRKSAGEIYNDFDTSSWASSIGTGILYQLSPRFNVTAYLGGISYSSSTTKDQHDDEADRKSSRFGLDFGSSFSTVGLEYKF